MRPRRWTIEELRAAVSESTSIRQVLGRLRLRRTGGNYSHIKRILSEEKIEITHFTGRLWSRGKKLLFKPKRSLEEILKKNTYYQSFKLKNRLFRAGLKPMHCEECGWNRTTKDGYLPLELDHINGDHLDNRIENLRVLCPNCHSLKPTHRGRKRRP